MGRHLATAGEIHRAADILTQGGLVVMPTETVYGLAADALNPSALEQVFLLKGRPHFDPLIAHVHGWDQLAQIATVRSQLARRLADQFWPGPLTLVLPKRKAAPDLLTSGLPTVAVRAPSHPVAQKLLRAFGKPIAAPSANRFGRISPTTPDHVREEFGDSTPYLLEGGSCAQGIESTIVRVCDGRPEVLRLGSLPVEALEEFLGQRVRVATRSVLKHPDAPGMLKHHYAPATPLEILPENWRASCHVPQSIAPGLLTYGTSLTTFSGPQVTIGTRGITQAARELFAALRTLDTSGCSKIYAERAPDTGLGRAINDRLTRASHS